MLKQEQSHWGNTSPLWLDSATGEARGSITPQFTKGFFKNQLIVLVVCLALPCSLQLCHNTLSSQPVNTNQDNQYASPLSQQILTYYYLPLFAMMWTTFQTTFLLLVLLSNPGYHPPSLLKPDSLPPQGKLCQKCTVEMDNRVFHCMICDRCCEGFTHHCHWLGKCIGSGNSLLLKTYFYGYLIGIILLLCTSLLIFSY